MAFVGIDETTRNLLREVRPMAMATLPAVLDKFYQTIAKFPDVQRMFPRPVAHAKAAQLAHWDMILSARFDADYVRSVTRIGETHHRLGLEPRWYIGGYKQLISGLIAAIETGVTARFAGKALFEKKAAMINAVVSAAMLDMDFATSVYLDAGKREKRETLERLAGQFEQTIAQIVGRVGTTSQTQCRSRHLEIHRRPDPNPVRLRRIGLRASVGKRAVGGGRRGGNERFGL
jgi:hemoglobin-like flavoprotein